MDEQARRRRHGRHDAARGLPGHARRRARRWPRSTAPTSVTERHRHRYEVNSRYRARLEEAGLVCSGTSPDGRLVEFVELPGHPFWVGTQAHPEFKSRPDRPHPLFREPGRGGARAGRGPRAPSHRPRRPRRRSTDRRADPATEAEVAPARAGPGFRPLGEPRSRRGRVFDCRTAQLARSRRGSPSSATSSAIPGRWPWCRCDDDGTVDPGPPVPAGGRIGRCSRSRPAPATSTASRPRRRPAASWPRRPGCARRQHRAAGRRSTTRPGYCDQVTTDLPGHRAAGRARPTGPASRRRG